jgi:hypothetical protein
VRPELAAEWYERQIQEKEEEGDSLALLEIALRILEGPPSRGQEARAPKLFERVADEALSAPAVLMECPETLARFLALLEQAGGHRAISGPRLESLTRRTRILAGLAAFQRDCIDEADARFREAALSAGGMEPAASVRADLLDDLRELRILARRRFSVLDAVLYRYGRGSAYDSAQFLEDAGAVVSGLRAAGLPPPIERAGQIGVLLAQRHPGLQEEFGRVSRISVTAKRGGKNEIRFSPQLAAGAAQLPAAKRQQFEAAARHALTAAAGFTGKKDLHVVWDLELADDSVSGPSLGLPLALAIISASCDQMLPPGTAATGAINLVGDVSEVGSVGAKASAALWHGIRLLLYPDENARQASIAADMHRRLGEAGTVLRPVRNLEEACGLVLPRVRGEVPDQAARRRRIGFLVGACAAGIAAAAWFGMAPGAGQKVWGTGSTRPILRSRYYVADGDFVLDALARGEYRNLFRFERDPLLLDNDTLRFARQIRATYFHPVEEFTRRNGDYRFNMTAAAYASTYPSIRRFRKPAGEFLLSGEVRRKDYRIPSGEDPVFYLEPDPPGTPPPESPKTVHRKAMPGVADGILRRRDPLTRDLVRANPGVWDLADLFIYMGEPPPCRGGEEEALRIRPLKLFFLDIENVGASPALNLEYAIRDLALPEREFLSVRRMRTAEEQLGKAVVKASRFPYEALKPGEHILVMLAVGLGGIGEDEVDTLPQGTLDQRPFGFYYDLSHPLAPREEPYYRSYLFGPQVRIDEVTYADASGRSYREPERRVAEQRIQVSDVVGSGSCPFVYGQERATGAWTNLGSVLVRFRGAGRFGEDRRQIPGRFGRIELRELEPEVSYIDRAELEVVGVHGETRRLLPLAPQLRASDGHCVRLGEGDRVELRFADEEQPWTQRVLHLWGHFIQLAPAPRRGATNPLPAAVAIRPSR